MIVTLFSCALLQGTTITNNIPLASPDVSGSGANFSSSWPVETYSGAFTQELEEDVLYRLRGEIKYGRFQRLESVHDEAIYDRFLGAITALNTCALPRCTKLSMVPNIPAEVAFWMSIPVHFKTYALSTADEVKAQGWGVTKHEVKNLLSKYDENAANLTYTASAQVIEFKVTSTLSCTALTKTYIDQDHSISTPVHSWLNKHGYYNPAQSGGMVVNVSNTMHLEQRKKNNQYELVMFTEEVLESHHSGRIFSINLLCTAPEPIFASDLKAYRLGLVKNNYWTYQLYHQ